MRQPSSGSKLGQLAVVLVLIGVFFAPALGRLWPYVFAGGVLLMVIGAIAALVRAIEGR